MDSDDILVGRLLLRREAIRLLGVGGAIALAPVNLGAWSQPAATCVVLPELTEGPFFVDRTLERSDIRTDTNTGTTRDGVPLVLNFTVSQITSGRCTPLPDAVVHVWQCDAVGTYSGVTDPRSGSGDATDNALRGTRTSDKAGAAQFTTIYPGWYRGRAVHIHFKIRTTAPAGAYEYTSQLFFPESLTDEILARPPYPQHGRRDTMNERDGIYRQGGAQLLLTPVRRGDGYEASMAITLNLSDAQVGRSDAEGGRGRGGRGRRRL